MIDSHVHLNRREFSQDLEAVRRRADAAGVTGFLNVGYDLESSEASAALAAADPQIVAAVGVHPHDASLLATEDGRPTAASGQILERLATLSALPQVVAIGEIGLDFFRDLSPRPAQRTALQLQLQLAADVELPVVLHIRDAYPETIALIESTGIPLRGAVLHAFAGDARTLEWARRHRLLVGIGGPVTYKNSQLPELLTAAVPGDLLLETDAPWLPPVPFRGKRNEPGYLVHTADRLAEVLGVSRQELEQRTDDNFQRLFDCLPGR